MQQVNTDENDRFEVNISLETCAHDENTETVSRWDLVDRGRWLIVYNERDLLIRGFNWQKILEK